MPKIALFVLVLLAVGTVARSRSSFDQSNDEDPMCDPGGPYGCLPGYTIEFDGRGSRDPDGTIVTYLWSFGDGHTGAGPVVTHRYDETGTYDVLLMVVDDKGNDSSCGTVAEIVAICECPPVCDPYGPYDGVAGVPVQFESRSTSALSCFPIVLYSWDFGDGATGQGPRPTHTYLNPGAYNITLTVTDSNGAPSACGTTALITPQTPVEPTTWGRIKALNGP
jgi:PKD repeat protein